MKPETRLLDYIDTMAPPVTAEEAMARRQSPNRSWRSLATFTKRPGGGAWALAAFVVVLAVGGLYFAFGGDDGEVANPATVPTPTTVPTSAPSPTLLSEEDEGRHLEPGVYFADADEDPSTTAGATFRVDGPGWVGDSQGLLRSNLGVLLHIHQVPEPIAWPSCALISNSSDVPLAPVPTAAGLADAFATSGFTVLRAPAPVSAFGLDGHHVVVEVPEACDGGSYLIGNGSAKFVDAGDVLEAWLFDMDGHVVMVESLKQGRGQTEEDLAALKAAIDTLVLTP